MICRLFSRTCWLSKTMTCFQVACSLKTAVIMTSPKLNGTEDKWKRSMLWSKPAKTRDRWKCKNSSKKWRLCMWNQLKTSTESTSRVSMSCQQKMDLEKPMASQDDMPKNVSGQKWQSAKKLKKGSTKSSLNLKPFAKNHLTSTMKTLTTRRRKKVWVFKSESTLFRSSAW